MFNNFPRWGFVLHHTWNISTGKFNSNYIASAALSLNTFREGHWVVLETRFFTIIVTMPPPKRWSIIPSGRVMLVVTTISSGRMSSLHILREDELENYTLFFFIPSGRVTLVVTRISSGSISSLHILREDELENYTLFLYTLWEGNVGSYQNILREDELFTYPQGG